jgi:hypothetical protein
MYYKSMYPELPVIPPQNYHNVIFDCKVREEQADHMLVVDTVTGERGAIRRFMSTLLML